MIYFRMHPNYFFIFLITILPILGNSQSDYLNYAQLSTKINDISKDNKCTLTSYGKSHGGKDLWALILGDKTKPSILLVAGLDGRHQAGTQFLVLLADQLLKNDSTKMLLKDKSIFIIPNANPDAIDSYFAKVKYEKSGNSSATDDDRNGKINDDPYDDLNNDGYITMMRIESLAGNYRINEKENRLMIPADPSKNQNGTHLLLTEGIDNNKNGIFNEDPSNGVNIDRNFAFDYPVFTMHSGEYAVSEREARDLMDFVANHQNIHTIINIGLQNSLSTPMKYDGKLAEQRIIKSWLENDVKVSESISTDYNKKNTLKNPPTLPLQPGSFVQTAYYHSGKYAFSTPVWWASIEEQKDTTNVKNLEKENKKGVKENYELQFLQWMDREALNDRFVEWKEVKHPDFPNQKVEVGGFKPYALYNPPVKYLEQQLNGHSGFVNALLSKMPTHDIIEPKIEKINDQLYRVTIKIVNQGFMPSYSGINDKLRFTSRLKNEIKLTKNQSIVSGRKVELYNALQPNENKEFSWLISGKGQITIESGCATTGVSKLDIDLK